MPTSLWFHLQQPEVKSAYDQGMTGWRKCGVHMHNGILSSPKENGIQLSGAKHIGWEDIMVNEISHVTERQISHILPHLWNSKIKSSPSSKRVTTRDWEE